MHLTGYLPYECFLVNKCNALFIDVFGRVAGKAAVSISQGHEGRCDVSRRGPKTGPQPRVEELV